MMRLWRLFAELANTISLAPMIILDAHYIFAMMRAKGLDAIDDYVRIDYLRDIAISTTLGHASSPASRAR